MSHRMRLLALLVIALVVGACTPGGGGTTGTPTTAATTPAATATGTAAATTAAATSPAATTPAATSPAATSPAATSPAAGDDLLSKVRAAGVMRVSTDPNYAPQSYQTPDGTFEGFDIDVAKEIGKRLGVNVQFETPSFDAVVAGSWSGRWDLSVGSVTITEERKSILGFTSPYYFTPAQIAATTASGITDLAGLAGKKICVGASTTYQFWLEGTLKLPEDAGAVATPPQGAEAFPLETDQLCAQAVKSGRRDFDGWLSSSTTVAAALKQGTPMVNVGDPVFFEPLAVAVDLQGPDHEAFLAEVDRIVQEMHQDGTLSTLSKKWFDGLDLTKRE
jgi:polar amino acid transport system substrate-binding protein